MKRFSFIIAALLLSVASINAMEYSEGRIKIAINESNGRFLLSYLTDISKSVWSPMFLDQDIRTTVATLSVDGKTYRLGDDSTFRIQVSKNDKGVQIQYKSSFITVTENFIFVKSKGSTLSDGVKIVFVLDNISEKDMSVGLRMLFDTNLGEASGLHFMTDKTEKILTETQLSGNFAERYWISQGINLSMVSLINEEGITKPDSVVFANWKRINDASWSFDVNASRNFNLLPYSINDSAVAQFYNPTKISRSSSRSITLLVGRAGENGFTQAESSSATSVNSTVDTSKPENIKAAVQTDLISVKDFIRDINKKLESGEKVTEEEMAMYRQIMDVLKKRAQNYK